jgi:hypothetical protein
LQELVMSQWLLKAMIYLLLCEVRSQIVRVKAGGKHEFRLLNIDIRILGLYLLVKFADLANYLQAV